MELENSEEKRAWIWLTECPCFVTKGRGVSTEVVSCAWRCHQHPEMRVEMRWISDDGEGRLEEIWMDRRETHGTGKSPVTLNLGSSVNTCT